MNDFEYPNFAGNARQMTEKAKLVDCWKQKTDKRPKVQDFKCKWCDEPIPDDHYYQCEQHNTIFCDNCAKNFNEREIDHKEAPRCKQKVYDRTDCIYKKKVLIDVS